MLVTHPITKMVYKFGYNGIDDMYSYWYENKDDILKYIDQKKRHIHITDELIQSFELKLRWSTWLGLWFRFYTRLELRKSEGVFDFKKVPIKYGFDIIDLDNLHEQVSGNMTKIDAVDLRGISLLNFKFNDVILENVDFSQSSLDFSEFYNVEFRNCNFSSTSFYSARIENCTFDKSCTLKDNDFSNAYISGKLSCQIFSPIIKRPSIVDLLNIKYGHPTMLYHTKVESSSFIDLCHDTSIKDQLNKYLKYY